MKHKLDEEGYCEVCGQETVCPGPVQVRTVSGTMKEELYGPCQLCGDTNFPLSFGGPGICPVCDCKSPSERIKELRTENETLKLKFEKLLVALEHIRASGASSVITRAHWRNLEIAEAAIKAVGEPKCICDNEVAHKSCPVHAPFNGGMQT